MRFRSAAVVTLALVVVTGGGVAGAATAGRVQHSAHLAYENCPAKDVVLTVSVPHSTFTPGQTVSYAVKLQNVSSQSCSFPGTTQPTFPGRTAPGSFMLGPCSPLPVAIDNARGVDVSPGPEAISCPAILGPPLAAHASISTAGSWDQMEGGLRPARVETPAAPGRYRVEVDGKVGVPFTIAGASPPAGVTSTP